ncbi:GPI transamidase component PIG-T-like [Lytechinus pictus]|uniref:GPI transamidase component PIG-T-like n=1 Tax=Lytechinus pictus TaxID=7653 RepID=UPI0030B9D084
MFNRDSFKMDCKLRYGQGKWWSVQHEAYGRNTSLLRHASLPREVVCTENLTPWKKLLPCDSKAGLASLFKADKLYNAHYHSLAVDIRPVCRSGMIPCRESAVQLSQSLNVVFGPLAQNRQGTRQDVSLRVLFGKVLSGPCPMASSSRVIVDLSKNYSSNLLTLSPPPSETIISSTGERSIVYAIYDVKEWSARKGTLNVALTWTKQLNYGNVKSPPLLAYRYLSGYGQEKGGVSCLLRNNLDQPFKVIYTETFPWYMRLYLHTLQIRIGDRIIEPDNVFYVPGRDRSNPYLLEVVLTLPATSDMTLKIDFDKAFLRWTEYPPDANIGFFINDGSIASKFFLCLYTKPLLIQLPTPDFSMPYNVICLACTVVAIGFGSLHNLTSRRFDFVDQSSSVGSLGMKLLAKFRKFRESGKRS